MLLKGFAVPVVGIMPYFGGGLTEKRWAFNRMEETVLPKVGIMTNRENGIFPFWLSPFFLEQRKGLLFFGGYLYLEKRYDRIMELVRIGLEFMEHPTADLILRKQKS